MPKRCWREPGRSDRHLAVLAVVARMTAQVKLTCSLVAIIALMVGAYVFGQHRYAQGEAAAALRYEVAIQMQKTEAAKTLASETERARLVELALNELKNTQELKDAEHVKTIADLSDRLRRLAGPAGRLRDPNQAGCGGGGGGTQGEAPTASGDRPADGAFSGGLLSQELSDLLRERIEQADRINAAYASCRAIAMTPD